MALIVVVFAATLGSRKLQEEEGRVLKLLSGSMMLGFGVLLLTAPEKMTNIFFSMGLLVGAIIVTLLVVVATHMASKQTKKS